MKKAPLFVSRSAAKLRPVGRKKMAMTRMMWRPAGNQDPTQQEQSRQETLQSAMSRTDDTCCG